MTMLQKVDLELLETALNEAAKFIDEWAMATGGDAREVLQHIDTGQAALERINGR